MATSDFDIRAVTPADSPDLVKMSDALGAPHGEENLADPTALARDLFAAPPWLFGLIACQGPRAVGDVLMFRTASAHHGRRGLDLHHLYVAPDCRGRGVGRAIIAAVEAQARRLGGDDVIIGTDPDNRDAQAAYEAMGYERRTPGPRFAKRLA